MTPRQIAIFQSNHYGPDGHPLDDDGVIGPNTAWALAVADQPRIVREVVRVATSQVGKRETGGTNRGPLPDLVLAPLRLEGVPWCAAFVSWVLRQVGVEGAIYTASARECLTQFERRHVAEVPAIGDVGGWVNPDGTGHVFLVIGHRSVKGVWHVITCEGNSANQVRLCCRPLDGLEFRALPSRTLRVSADVPKAPIVVRESAGTR